MGKGAIARSTDLENIHLGWGQFFESSFELNACKLYYCTNLVPNKLMEEIMMNRCYLA